MVRNDSGSIQFGDRRAVIADGQRRATVRFEQRPNRVLGSLELPVLKVDFYFQGYTGNQIKRFNDKFELSFLRMGGG